MRTGYEVLGYFCTFRPFDCPEGQFWCCSNIGNSDPEVAIWWGTSIELVSAAAQLRRGEVDDAGYARILSKIGL